MYFQNILNIVKEYKLEYVRCALLKPYLELNVTFGLLLRKNPC